MIKSHSHPTFLGIIFLTGLDGGWLFYTSIGDFPHYNCGFWKSSFVQVFPSSILQTLSTSSISAYSRNVYVLFHFFIFSYIRDWLYFFAKRCTGFVGGRPCGGAIVLQRQRWRCSRNVQRLLVGWYISYLYLSLGVQFFLMWFGVIFYFVVSSKILVDVESEFLSDEEGEDISVFIFNEPNMAFDQLFPTLYSFKHAITHYCMMNRICT